ncbi:Rhomboid family protein [Anaeromyxobacter dehalogenans 2CP-1]|uniref:Rhomboid family protein n=1 Tax=Anaeromyxobacter dehalogenans (strain ATCC BAA-258 / DSM 21875 / 2CP-1) TaxID=455488 RepID=B8JF85_ANAD2|nr:rhombosortase [Anaeromyxobacter dehalogenans]ACL64442.1 Rhomboid family protein [Anaeromyxobacter dehalogenans 2CP-1]
MRRVPWVTVAVLAVALGAYLVPALGELLILDRARVEGGEGWRVLTGSLVHFSASHLAADALAFGVAGAMLERRGRARFAVLALASALAVGLAVLWLEPTLQRFAGLSGVAYAAIVALALVGLREGGAMATLSGVALAACVAKLAWELSTGRMLLVGAPPGIVAVPLAHLAGAIAAVAVTGTGRRPGAARPVAGSPAAR